MRFLIDECLSPALVDTANAAGFEAHHVVRRGWSGLKDPQIFRRVLDEGLVFVTNNRRDFHALIGRAELHPGLVVLVENAARAREIEHFRAALDEIAAGLVAGRDMINSYHTRSGDRLCIRAGPERCHPEIAAAPGPTSTPRHGGGRRI